jgi:hypothetical protein
MQTRVLLALLRKRHALARHDHWTRRELERHQATALYLPEMRFHRDRKVANTIARGSSACSFVFERSPSIASIDRG